MNIYTHREQTINAHNFIENNTASAYLFMLDSFTYYNVRGVVWAVFHSGCGNYPNSSGDQTDIFLSGYNDALKNTYSNPFNSNTQPAEFMSYHNGNNTGSSKYREISARLHFKSKKVRQYNWQPKNIDYSFKIDGERAE